MHLIITIDTLIGQLLILIALEAVRRHQMSWYKFSVTLNKMNEYLLGEAADGESFFKHFFTHLYLFLHFHSPSLPIPSHFTKRLVPFQPDSKICSLFLQMATFGFSIPHQDAWDREERGRKRWRSKKEGALTWLLGKTKWRSGMSCMRHVRPAFVTIFINWMKSSSLGLSSEKRIMCWGGNVVGEDAKIFDWNPCRNSDPRVPCRSEFVFC